MSRVFTSEGTGAAVYVFSNDHCPPHISARHRAEDWIARVRFSYLSSAVELWSIEPMKHAPARRVINRLLGEIRAHLSACRRTWWNTQRTACLERISGCELQRMDHLNHSRGERRGPSRLRRPPMTLIPKR